MGASTNKSIPKYNGSHSIAKVSNIEEHSRVFQSDMKNENIEISTKLTDVEDREQSYQSSLLELSNEIELAKSSFVEFKHKMSQNVALNDENIQNHDDAIKDILETASELEWQVTECRDKSKSNEQQLKEFAETSLDNKNHIQGLLNQHTSDREHILKQRQHLQKVQEELDIQKDKMDGMALQLNQAETTIEKNSRFDSVLRKQAENAQTVRTLVRNLSNNVTEVSRRQNQDFEEIISKFDSYSVYFDNKVKSEITALEKNAGAFEKRFLASWNELEAKVDASANIIDSRMTDDETRSKNLRNELEQLKEIMSSNFAEFDTSQSELQTMTEILVETNRKISDELRKLELKSDKATQILEDKLTLPISIQQKKQASIEQLVVSELERLELEQKTMKAEQEFLNETLVELGMLVKTHDRQVLKSMESNRRIFGQLGKQMNTIEVRTIQTESLVGQVERDMDKIVKLDLTKLKANFEKAFKYVRHKQANT